MSSSENTTKSTIVGRKANSAPQKPLPTTTLTQFQRLTGGGVADLCFRLFRTTVRVPLVIILAIGASLVLLLVLSESQMLDVEKKSVPLNDGGTTSNEESMLRGSTAPRSSQPSEAQNNKMEPKKRHPGNIHFKYVNPENRKSFSVCLCPKCGSSSVSEALYGSLTGRVFDKKNGDGERLWFYNTWKVNGVESNPSPGDLHFIIYRDPVDRYISAYYSKVQCCEGTLDPCYPDQDDFIPTMLKRNGNTTHGHLKCLPFPDFVLQLERAHALGAKRIEYLNAHWQPQHRICPIPKDAPTLVTPVREFEPILKSLQGYGLLAYPYPHRHSTKRDKHLDQKALDRLALVAQDEYDYFGKVPKEREQRAQT